MSTTTLNSEKKKALIPEFRFQEFSEVSLYKKYSFNDVFQFSTGKNIKQNEASPDFEIPCVRYGELYHMYNEVIHKVINKTNLDKSELVFSKGDEILLPSAGEDPLDIGSASALTIENVAIGRTINILRPIKGNVYSQIYASYYINEKLRKKISKLAKGSSISNVYNSDLKTLEIIIPALPEQQKIASFLSAVDEKIQQLSRKNELLEQYKKGLKQQLFSGNLRFKDYNGKDYSDWEKVKLYNLCEYKNGGSFENYVCDDGEYNLISLNSIDINGKIKNKHKKVSITDNSLKKGDLIMVLSDVAYGNFLGLTDIVPGDNFVLNQRMGALKPIKDFNSFYLKTFINFNQTYFKLKGQGSSQQNLSKGDIINFIVDLPCLEEQQKIANFLSSIDSKIESISQQINQTQSFKKGLLQQMFV
jgi:type I restriction enzyme S subunit